MAEFSVARRALSTTAGSPLTMRTAVFLQAVATRVRSCVVTVPSKSG
jgi:hypothetical protein